MKWLYLILLMCFSMLANAASIVLNKTNATVWLHRQIVHGQLVGFSSTPSITIVHNDTTFSIQPGSDGSFQFTVFLKKGLNTMLARASNGNILISSGNLELTLPYEPFPVLKATASLQGQAVRLSPKRIEDNTGYELTYEWKPADTNPAPVQIEAENDSTVLATIPSQPGTYYFTLYARHGNIGDSAKTYVTRSGGTLEVYDIENVKPSWIYNAIIYQVTPYIFTNNRKYVDIEEKLTEIKALGVNTLYLQPVFKTERGGQGYDITDYFSLRPDLGTENELRSLIEKSKSMGMRVLFDMVPNHTAITHPYARDKVENGEKSHYYNYYQSRRDSAEYSIHYHNRPEGFIYYFWTELVNLDYGNEEVQRWMIEACKYWIRNFDIDGYRFDAVWGVNARTPAFSKRMTHELKSLKPDLLLIAEDKPTSAAVYRSGYDAAYDWDKSEEWVSKWAWQYEFDEEHRNTIFNHPSIGERRELLRKALFNDGDSIGLRLRYLENNDLHRFVSNHSRDVTKMAATLLFALNGLPMMYNGQETAFRLFPYTSGPIYDKQHNIRSYDPDMFDFYARLCSTRISNPALTSGVMKEVELNNAPGVVAFSRKTDSQEVIVIINMSGARTTPAMKLNMSDPAYQNGIHLKDLVGGDSLVARKQVNGYTLPVDAYTTRVLAIDNRAVDLPPANTRLTVVPNPGKGKFALNYQMNAAGRLHILICDATGKSVMKMRRDLPAGRASLPVQLPTSSPGTYYIKVDDGSQVSCATYVFSGL